MMVTFTHKGTFTKTERFLKFVNRWNARAVLEKYGKRGVAELAAATPKKTGATAESWSYEIRGSHGNYVISWTNSNTNNGRVIAILIQYGHGTGWGGYVEGIDYINPAMRPIFEQIAEDAWKEVSNA